MDSFRPASIFSQFLLVLIVAARVLWFAPSAEASSIFWSSQAGTIGAANLDGTGVNPSLITGAAFPVGIAVEGNYIYWGNAHTGTIGRANLDGTGVNQSFITGASDPTGIAVDGSHIYWADAGAPWIGRANLDGSGVNQFFITVTEGNLLSSPGDVAIEGNYIYWTNFFQRSIGRANLDGTGVNPSFISIDPGESSGPALRSTEAISTGLYMAALSAERTSTAPARATSVRGE